MKGFRVMLWVPSPGINADPCFIAVTDDSKLKMQEKDS
jgi:hypothetical protein